MSWVRDQDDGSGGIPGLDVGLGPADRCAARGGGAGTVGRRGRGEIGRGGGAEDLRDFMAARPVLAGAEIRIDARGGPDARKGRKAKLELRAARNG